MAEYSKQKFRSNYLRNKYMYLILEDNGHVES